jgi:hypothetical protein
LQEHAVALVNTLLLLPHLQVFLSEVVKDHNSSSSYGGSSSSCDGEPCLVPMVNAPLMDAAESLLLLQGPGSIAFTPAGGAVPLVHEAVARHAKARPDAACLVHDGKVFTYHEVSWCYAAARALISAAPLVVTTPNTTCLAVSFIDTSGAPKELVG